MKITKEWLIDNNADGELMSWVGDVYEIEIINFLYEFIESCKNTREINAKSRQIAWIFIHLSQYQNLLQFLIFVSKEIAHIYTDKYQDDIVIQETIEDIEDCFYSQTIAKAESCLCIGSDECACRGLSDFKRTDGFNSFSAFSAFSIHHTKKTIANYVYAMHYYSLMSETFDKVSKSAEKDIYSVSRIKEFKEHSDKFLHFIDSSLTHSMNSIEMAMNACFLKRDLLEKILKEGINLLKEGDK